VHINDLPTPAVVIDIEIMRRNLDAMVAVHPGHRLRPHVKAHKSSGIAAEQVLKGHNSFTCATPREILGLVKAGVGNDLLLANETVDPQRLAALAAAQDDALITVAVDSRDTLDAADRAGIRNVLIDVNVGLPRCGIAPQDAGWLADSARVRGITVRGVMGYEGHLMMVADRDEKKRKVHEAMALLAAAHADVGGDIVSAGGTGTYDMFAGTTVNEVQAGSYALMDTQYGQLGSPFAQAMWVVGTVISANGSWSVCDVGLKSLGMDHGNPSIEGHSVWFCSDEHITFSPNEGTPQPKVGERVFVTPAHIDPTMAMHDVAYVADTYGNVLGTWPVDLRGW
jgi:D-serine deaminase-like pyridoxal phosphate-dependent protein